MATGPDPRTHDPEHQAKLRARAVHRGAAELLRAVAVNSYRTLDWPTPGACASPEHRHLFFAQYEDDPLDPAANLKIEKNRAARLDAARAICVGDPKEGIPACPMWAQCLSWRLQVGGQDKHSFAAGLSWRSIKDVSAEIRRRARRPILEPTELVAC